MTVVVISSEGGGAANLPLYVVGIGAHLPRQDDFGSALAEVPAAWLVFMHHPASFEAIPSRQSPLALAAHTHGGQIRLPFLPESTWLSYAKAEKIHSDGWIDGYGEPSNRLYVYRGIGFSEVPIRINCPRADDFHSPISIVEFAMVLLPRQCGGRRAQRGDLGSYSCDRSCSRHL